jgi:arylsulfatase A-like enzyme/ABC-type molybdate transport system substrate-binding protein
MTSGAFTAPYLELSPQFERTMKVKVVTVTTSIGVGAETIPNRVLRGDPVDVVILPEANIDDLVRAGKIVAGSKVLLARSAIGIAVRAGAPRPDISSVEALKRTLLNAKSVAYSSSVSGDYLVDELFPRLGIAEQMKAKGRRVVGERVGAVVARGEAEIGFQQISELLPIGGIAYIGPLPPDVQRVTTLAAAVVGASPNRQVATALIRHLASPDAVSAITKSGLEPVSVVQQQGAARPNIIFIMTDDHAAHAIGAYGSRVNKTPHLDRLAREGALLTSVFATNSICTPSRAAILTGQYSHINGVTMFNRFDSSRMTVARLLQQGGYYTGMVGKWHLGSDPVGFDRWEILPGQGLYKDPVFYTATGQKTYTGRYATEVITDLAVDFIEHRPRDKPFFLMMHHKAPHRPWDPSDTHAAHFAAQRIPEPVTLWDSYATRTDALHENQQRVADDLNNRDLKLTPPANLSAEDLTKWFRIKPQSVTVMQQGHSVMLTGEALTRWKYQRYMQDYLATVQSVDDSVGQVLALLDTTGLSRNTMVVYTSDQGFFLGDHGLFDKRFMYEESIRMPFLVRWPERIGAGTRSDALVLNIDFAPTFLEAGSLSPLAEMQGRSMLPVLRGRAPDDWRTSMYYRYYHDPGDHNTRAHLGVRTRTHKLIYFWKKDQWELFDLVNDPYELHNLYGQPGQEALTATLKMELAKLKRELRDEDQLANEQLPNGVDGPIAKLRGK